MQISTVEALFFIGSMVLSFLLYPGWIRFAYKYHLGEEVRPTGPLSHTVKRGTPTMGGIVFLIVVAAVTLLLNISRTQTVFPVFIAALAGLLGVFEDLTKIYRKSNPISANVTHTVELKSWLQPIRKLFESLGSKTYKGDLQSYQKFLIELGIGGFVSYWTYVKLGWDYVWLPLLGEIHIGVLYPIVITLLFILMLNCIAFTDGLDGLAGSLAFVSFMAFWFIAHFLNYNNLAIYSSTFAGALLPFLYFNVYPARIFMGNVGSHTLGATLTILAIVLHREVALLLICLVFLIDGLSSPMQLISKNLTGKKIFLMAPLHHHFELLGWPETKVVFRFLIFGVLSAFLGIFVAVL